MLKEFSKIFPLESPRPGQDILIEKIINAFNSPDKNYVILDAPTGTGKSAVAVTVANYFKQAYILTSQKVLQEQYSNDFGLHTVYGKDNYICRKKSKQTCALGACLTSKSKSRCKTNYNTDEPNGCPYFYNKYRCLSSDISLLNYNYYFNLALSNQYQMNKKIIICDECHNIQRILIDAATVTIDYDLMSNLDIMGCFIPSASKPDEDKIDWLLNKFKNKLIERYTYCKHDVETTRNASSLKKLVILQRLLRSIYIFESEYINQETIIIDDMTDSGKITFRILNCSMIFKRIFGEDTKILFMSATILSPRVFADELGIDFDKVEYIKCKSAFPVENRLIYYSPAGSMSFNKKQYTLPKLVRSVERILNQHRNEKGIIHTVSYDIALKIISSIKDSEIKNRLILLSQENKQTGLKLYKRTKKPAVLISPSITEGLDFKDELSRFCIICKVPYLSLADKWVKAKLKSSQDWYNLQTCINLIQMTGRSVRSETDHAVSYILDSDFINLANHCIDIFPDYWKESVVVEQ